MYIFFSLVKVTPFISLAIDSQQNIVHYENGSTTIV